MLDAPENAKWANPSAITYSIAPAIPVQFDWAIELAASQWSAVSNAKLIQTNSATSDIVVSQQNLAMPTIGLTTYLAPNGYFNVGVTVNVDTLAGLNANPQTYYNNTTATVYQVALHEFGHALGLDHSPNYNAIMNAKLGMANPFLSNSDIAAIDALYGANTVALINSNTLNMHRFFNTQNGTHVDSLNTDYAGPYVSEGIAFGTAASGDLKIYAFNLTSGTFFTASDLEASTIHTPEAASFFAHSAPMPGDAAIFRFFSNVDGSHFYTASMSEAGNVISFHAQNYVYEGIAFYAPSPNTILT